MPTYDLGSTEYQRAVVFHLLTEEDKIKLKNGKIRLPNTKAELHTIKMRNKQISKGEKYTQYQIRAAESLNLPIPEELNLNLPKLTPVENLTPVIGKIKDDIEELRKLGKDSGQIYNSSNDITWFAYLAVLKKFNSKCVPVYGITADKRQRNFGIRLIFRDNEKSELLEKPELLDDLGVQLKKCLKRKVEVIPIHLSIHAEKKIEKGYKYPQSFSHANMLIYRPFEKIVERFEPQGQTTPLFEEQTNTELIEIFKRLEPYIGKVKYVPPIEICPFVKGLQSLESSLKSVSSGYCSMWSLFVMEMVLNNPSKTTTQIIDDVMKISQQNPQYLKDVISGYVKGTEKMLDETLKFLKKEGFSYDVKPSELNIERKLTIEFGLDILFNIDMKDILSKYKDNEDYDTFEDDLIKVISLLIRFTPKMIRKVAKLLRINVPYVDDKDILIIALIDDVYDDENLSHLLLFKPEDKDKWMKLNSREVEEYFEGEREDLNELFGSGKKSTGEMVCECQKLSVWDWF